jgi:uncharacterized protein (TIGR03435 family)
VTGADLRKRVERIMANRIAPRLTAARKTLVAAAASIALIVPVLIGVVKAQAGKGLVFDVASVRPTKSDAQHFSIRFMPGGALNVGHTTLKVLISFAYDVREFQVSGGPGWIDSDRFDIQAKTERYDGLKMDEMNDAQRRTHADQMRERLRALLADRFQLRVHTESKGAPVYALVIARGGHKLKPAKEGPGGSQRGGGGGGTFHATRWTPAMLAKTLSRFVGRDVEDRTGISGEFDIDLEWSPDVVRPPNAGADAPTPVGSDGPSIFTALQEQLGLRLESSRGSVDVIVVDRAERPSEN